MINSAGFEDRVAADWTIDGSHALPTDTVSDTVVLKGLYQFEFRKAGGGLYLRTEEEQNIIVNGGLAYLVQNGTSTATHYTVLLGTTPSLSATSTISTVTLVTSGFSQSVRPTWTEALTGTATMTNSASRAHYDFTGSTTVGGAGLVTGSSTLGDTGSTTLLSARALSGGDVSPQNGWALDLTITIAATDSGS